MYNVVEFFSGIGSQAKALKNLDVQINTVGTSEWDVHAIVAYDLIHNGADMPEEIQMMSKEQLLEKLQSYTFSNSGKTPLDYISFKTYSTETLKRIYTSIIRNHNFVDISALNGNQLPDNIDIMTYSFPCQDLSNVGAFHGYNKGIDMDSGSRSSLLWQVGRILSEMRENGKTLPRFLLMENVPTLLSERHFKNFSTWICDLGNLGYISKYYQLNACDFGLPQNRPRLLMVSVYVGNNTEENELIAEYFKETDEKTVIEDYKKTRYFRQYTVKELLRLNYGNKKIFNEAVECTPNDTVSRQKIWDENPQIVLPGYIFNKDITMVRTITTKQDRNPNSGNLYFDSGVEGKSKFRYLTPRECMLFMGFTDDDFKILKKNNMEFHKGDALFARDKVIRMAGNSIPVKLLEGIFLQILQIDELLKTYRSHIARNLYGEIDHTTEKKEICSQMFKRRIRQSFRTDEIHPENADIYYPRYRTAIYIENCFWHGHTCEDAELPAYNRTYWSKIIERNREVDSQKYKIATDMGWNAVVVWECQLCNNKHKNMDELSNVIIGNRKSHREHGEVIYLGGH